MKQNHFPIFILALFIMGVFVIELLRMIRKNRELLRLYTEYDIAKLTGDKARAFEIGRAFYKTKKGTVTTEDEQMLESDLRVISSNKSITS